MMPPYRIEADQRFPYRDWHLAYHEAGTGAPMIMLHNGGCSHIIWKHQIEYFSRTHRVLALDLLGFGASARPNTPYTLDRQVEILHAFIEAKRLAQPTLLGNCIGGAIALDYARRYPAQSGPLILCNVCGGVPMMRHFHPYLFPSHRSTYSETIYRWMFAFGQWPVAHRQIIRRLYGSPPDRSDEIYRRLLHGLRHPLQPHSRIMLMRGLDSYSPYDRYETLPPVRLPPTFVCWGQRNRVLPVERGKWLIQHLAPDHHKIYSQQGHLLMAEAPEAFNRDVAQFLHSIPMYQTSP